MSLERTARPKTVTRAHGLLLALCFTAYILRLFHLDAQSLWYDEGFSAWVATQPFDQIIARTSTEMNPPLYYFLLHIWIAFCGQSEFSLRFLSLMPSVMLVPMFYLLVRRLLGSVTGWIAALLATFSPMYVWYAQEARVYALLTLLTLMSSYFLWLWTERATWRRWLALLLCNVVSVYLHYFGFFIIAFQLVYFLIWWTRQETRWATLGTGLAVPTLTLVASVPWLQFALRQIASDTSYVEGTLPLFEVLRKAFALFSTGHSMLEQDAVPAAGALVLFAIVGWVGIGRLRSGPLDAQREDPFRRSMTAVGAVRQFLVLYLLTPFTLFYLVAYQRPKFHPRYLMIASPPFLILVSACIAVLWLGFWRSRGTAARRGYISLAIGSLIAILVGSITLSSLANLYFDVRFSKDDFRSAVAAIRANRADGQLTLLVSGHMFPIYLYYDPQGAWVPLPDEPTLSTQRVLGYNVANDLNAKLRGKTDVWLLLWQDEFVDPAGFVTTILDSQAQRLAQNQSFWGVRLMHYRVPPGTVFSDQPQIQQPLNVNYGGEIALLGYNLPATASPADAGLNITLYWRALKDLHEDYSVSLRVRDSDGRLVGKLDARPVAYEYPTTRWRAGDVLFGKFQIPLELGAPPSNYRLEVIVYSSDSVEGLDILDAGGKRAGKVAVLQPVPIERPTVQPAVDKLQMKRPLRFDFGNGIEMLGMDVQQVNPEPGEPIEISIYWRARSVPSSDFRLVFELRRGADQAAPLFGADDVFPVVRGLPTTRWKAGDIFRAQYTYYVPNDMPAGTRTLRMAMIRELFNPPATSFVALGDVQIQPSTRLFRAPAVQTPDSAQYGDSIRNSVQLFGHDLSPAPLALPGPTALRGITVQPGGKIVLTLYWQPLLRTRTAYNVFVHVHPLSQPTTLVAQRDSAPVGGKRPTTTWIPGEFIADSYEITFGGDVPLGDYVVSVGLYDPVSGQRLPMTTLGQTGTSFTLRNFRVLVR